MSGIQSLVKNPIVNFVDSVLSSDSRSKNEFNSLDLSIFRIIESGENSEKWEGVKGFYHNYVDQKKVNRLAILIWNDVFLDEFPIIFDRNWIMIDGIHRFKACQLFGMNYKFVRLDYDSKLKYQENIKVHKNQNTF